MNRCLTLLLSMSMPISVLTQTVFQMGNSVMTNLCEGILYDSGGESGNYQAIEDFEFTVCPDMPPECLSINVESFRIESGGDYLSIYEGQNTSGALVAELTGSGNNRQFEVSQGCATFRFVSNGVIQDAGFKMSWKCEATPCSDQEVFPPATKCENALPITGCNIEIPSSISVGLDTSELFFFQNGRNSGCWELGVDSANFIWFYFQAQADGKFGFLVESEIDTDESDYDINVWGPVNNQSEFCDHARNQEPVRSTFANEDVTGYGLTGLADVNPILGGQVLDDCENQIVGDGFVRRLDVEEGKYYLIVVNDFDGVVFNRGIKLDFSNSTQGIFDTPDDVFSVNDDIYICQGETTQLKASGGLLYHWLNPDNLSCVNCENPIASPSATTTYDVEIKGVCGIDTMQITVFVNEVNVGNDTIGCVGTDLILDSGIGVDSISWTVSGGSLSCNDCPDPIISLPENDSLIEVFFNLTLDNCLLADTLLIQIESNASVEIIPNEVTTCAGEIITLNTNVNFQGGDFVWSTGETTDSIEIEFFKDTLVSVEYQLNNGCEIGSNSILIEEHMDCLSETFEIPNIFSPNGDSRNEFFKPIISQQMQLVNMKIFNRWGQVVYDNESNEIGWNGEFDGEMQSVDVFIYQISIQMPDGHILDRVGDVTLLR